MSQQHPHDPHQGQPQGEPGHGSNLPDEAPAGRHAAPPQGQPHGAAPEGQQAYGSQSQQAYGSQGRHAYGSQGAQWGQQPQGVHQPSSQPGLNQAPAAQQPGFGQSHAAPSQPRRSAPGQAPQAGYGQQAQGGQQTQGGHQAYGNQHAQGGWQQPNPQQQGFAPQAHPQHSPHHPQPGPAQSQQRFAAPQRPQHPHQTHQPQQAYAQPGQQPQYAPAGQPPAHQVRQQAWGGPEQRDYQASRFSPTVTQEMRLRTQVQQHQGQEVQAGWTQQATQGIRVGGMPLVDPQAGANTARLIVAIVVCSVLGLGLLAILLIGALSFKGVGSLIVLLSLLPLSFIILMVLWFDRWRPQPKLLLGMCILWGAVAAVVLVFITQTLSVFALGAVGINASGDVVGAVVLAPVFEEGAKGILLIALVFLARKYFDGPLDGWMYGSLIGAGFAFTENILYLSNAFSEGQTPGLLLTFAMRCVVSPLLHSTFTAMIGIAIGLAAKRGQWWLILVMAVPGYLAGAFLHGLWNGTATLTSNLPALMSILVILVLAFLVSALWFGTGLFFRFEETKQTRLMLGDYANAGWLTHAEVDMLGTWSGRRTGKNWARQFPGGLKEMKRMIALAASLAALRSRLLSGHAGQAAIKSERYELTEFTQARSRLMASTQQRTW